jgi:hypothetical protein
MFFVQLLISFLHNLLKFGKEYIFECYGIMLIDELPSSNGYTPLQKRRKKHTIEVYD